MDSAADSSIAARGALYLVLLGGVAVAIGLFLVVTGAAAVIAGRWFGPDGGMAPVVSGAFFGATGVWAARRGREVQRGRRSDNSVGK